MSDRIELVQAIRVVAEHIEGWIAAEAQAFLDGPEGDFADMWFWLDKQNQHGSLNEYLTRLTPKRSAP